MSKLADRHISAGPDIEKSSIRIVFHHEYTGIGCIVGSHEFAPRFAAAPHCDFGHLAYFGFVKASNEGSRNVTVQWMIVVVWAVQVRWHDRNKIIAMLLAIGFT